MNKFTIITAANSSRYPQLQNLLWSIAEWCGNARVIIWNLGLKPEELSELNKYILELKLNATVRDFDFSKYPPHFSMAQNSGRAGFRPIVMNQAAQEFGGMILWLDADAIIQNRLAGIRAIARQFGIYCPMIFGATLKQALHPSSIQPLGVTDEIGTLPMRECGIVCFNCKNAEAMNLLKQWQDAALNPAIAAPDGSSKQTHWQSAVFGALLSKTNLKSVHLSLLNQNVRTHFKGTLKEAKRRFSQPLFFNPKPIPLSVAPENKLHYQRAIHAVAAVRANAK